MTADRWDRIGELFHSAGALPAADRAAFLDEQCGGDAELRREVESLLAHHDEPPSFLGDAAIGFLRATWDPETATSRDRDPAIDRRLGPYRIDERIAGGGMGTVYRGSRQDGLLEQTVAIKLLHPWRHAEELAQRFRAEWQTLADLVHPNIAQVLDAGVTDDDTPYLVMEYLEGGAIDDFCDRERLGIDRRLELFESIARAVHFAHQNLVVHRDLKPANVLVTGSGEPKLLDFGIAKVLAPDGRDPTATENATRTLLMTPFYASPEQLRGEPVTTATDIYSLGVILYELLTGRRPHAGGTGSSSPPDPARADRPPTRPSTAVLQSLPAGDRATPPPSVEVLAQQRGTSAARLRRRLRGDLDNIVMKAMHGEARRRYASAEALADDVRRHLDDRPVIARPDTLLYRTRKLVARNRIATAALLVALTATAAGTATTAWQASIAARERDDAAAERDHARIEANSSMQIVEILSDAFLVSSPLRTSEQLDRVATLLEHHAHRIRREHAERPHERANLLDAIGRVYVELDLYDAAQKLVDEAMAIRERNFGHESLETALSHSSQGQLAYRRGDHRLAAEHFRRSLDLQQRLPAGVHTDVAQAMNDLAVTLRLTGSLDEAETLHERALALRLEVSGEQHLTVAESLNNLAAIHTQRGDHGTASDLLQRALTVRRACVGERHPLIAQTLNNLATVSYELGEPQLGIDYMRRSIELYRSIPGSDVHALAKALTNLAGMLRGSGAGSEAQAAATEALELVRRQADSADSSQLAEALQAVAEAAHSTGSSDTAKVHYVEALAVRRRTFPEGHPAIATLLCNYGALLVRSGPAGEAESVLREAVATLRAIDPQPAGFLAPAERNLGRCLVEQERFDEAEPFLLSACRRFEGRHETQWQRTRDELRALYEAWGKPERAREYSR